MSDLMKSKLIERDTNFSAGLSALVHTEADRPAARDTGVDHKRKGNSPL